MPPKDIATTFDGSKIDLRLKPDSRAVDSGLVLPGFNDAFAGAAADMGAQEAGRPALQFGVDAYTRKERIPE